MILQILFLVVWSIFGIWMFRCLGRPPKKCLQCVFGRYIALLIVMVLLMTVFSK